MIRQPMNAPVPHPVLAALYVDQAAIDLDL
jgi:hypothetical protein